MCAKPAVTTVRLLVGAVAIVCTLADAVSFAHAGGGTGKVTERGAVSLAGLDVLTPEGVRRANWRIQQMAQRLCLQIVNMDERDAATCVDKAVADAQQRLDAVISPGRAGGTRGRLRLQALKRPMTSRASRRPAQIFFDSTGVSAATRADVAPGIKNDAPGARGFQAPD